MAVRADVNDEGLSPAARALGPLQLVHTLSPAARALGPLQLVHTNAVRALGVEQVQGRGLEVGGEEKGRGLGAEGEGSRSRRGGV